MAANKELTEAYMQMAMDRYHQGWSGYLLTFMFDPLDGSKASVDSQMDNEVERTYAKLLTRIVRRPNAPSSKDKLPFWIVSPDLPVPKRDKDHFRDLAVNDGNHRHAAAFIHPDTRMTESLKDHIDAMQGLYSGGNRPLFRLHAEEIVRTPEEAVRYVLKGLERGRISGGDIYVLPRTRGELTVLTPEERRADAVD